MKPTFKTKHKKMIALTSILILSSALFALFLTFFGAFVVLSENQILYVFSASAQVLAGLYGLTLTGYLFYHSKLEQKVIDDNTLEDQINKIKIESYDNQLAVGIISLTAISMSLLTIFIYNNAKFSEGIIDFILNFSSTIVFINITMIVLVSLVALNPSRIENLSNKLKREIEKNYDKGIVTDNIEMGYGNIIIKDDDGKGYGKFMICFNKLSNLMEDYANELEENRPVSYLNEKKRNRSITELAKVLNIHEIIAGRDVELLDMFRMYRNATAHGTELRIDLNILEKIEVYYKHFKKMYNVRDDIEERNAAYKVLRETVFDE